MKKIKLKYEELVEENKQQLLKDKLEIEKIERKIEERRQMENLTVPK